MAISVNVVQLLKFELEKKNRNSLYQLFIKL